MTKSERKPIIQANLAPWFEARQRFHLSHAVVQMARELGLNPKKFGSLADTRGSPWKAPLPEFIAHCYYKAYKRESPAVVRSLEQVIKDNAAKKEQQRERKVLRKQVESFGGTAQPQSHASQVAHDA
jgi:hypothetical protein